MPGWWHWWSASRRAAVSAVGADKVDEGLQVASGLSMNRALLAAGLADRVRVTLFPVITGQTGLEPIFRGAPDFDLELIEHLTLDGHVQELIYRPTLHT
ncbi:dihydrofolate reductase family protein [Streptomyces sp. NPDC088196]|uniref:dihydrofolate reductase family protein n=1 Tax=Streptomyces sp. NPDC088196 TaxID=3154868 RepID=UPI00344B3A00